MLYFLEKSPQRWGLRLQTPVGLRRLGASPQDPQLLLSLNLRVTFSADAQIARHH